MNELSNTTRIRMDDSMRSSILRFAIASCIVLLYVVSFTPKAEAVSYASIAKSYGADGRCVTLLLHCISRESGGNPSATNGQYLGILQMGSAWGTKAQRLDPNWEIRVFVRGYKAYGPRWVNQHWCKWHGCGGYALGFGGSTRGRKHGPSKVSRVHTETRNRPRRVLRKVRHEAKVYYRRTSPKLVWLERRDERNYRMALSADARMEHAAFCEGTCHGGLDR